MPIAQLDDRAVVRVAGADAATLLHNVLTLDMPGVEAHGSGYGALLTPQGKILWDFILHKAEGAYFADLRADAAESFAKRLSLYRLRAQVDITASPELAAFVAWPGLPERAADPRVAELGSRWVAPRSKSIADSEAADWHRHRIALAVPEGGIDFVLGDTFPHDAAMDALNGIAFTKGCYIGQEVVSRMRHRGTARRRIVAARSASALPEAGTEITAGDRPLGRLGSSADGRAIALLRLDRTREALDASIPIRAGAADITVSLPSWATYGWPSGSGAESD